MATTKEFEQNAANAVVSVLTAANKALEENNLEEYAKKLAELDKVVDEWNKEIQNAAFKELAKADNPMIAAVERFYIDSYAVKEVKTEAKDRIMEVKTEKRSRRIDLKGFCESEHLDTAWVTSTERLRQLLEVRETETYSMKPEELAQKSYYFISMMKKKEAGETPDSNTQIVRQLQKVVDEAIFVDNGEGKNIYKCTNHDIAFIQDAVTKFDAKGKCSIAMMNKRAFQTVMMSVFSHMLGEAYKVKTIKTKES